MATTLKAKPAKVIKDPNAKPSDRAKKDLSPKWDGCEDMTAEQFMQHYHIAMQYYNLEYSSRDLKPQVLKWLAVSNYDKSIIDSFKKTKDWRSTSTMGGIASCLLRGMPPQRADFNNGKSTATWLYDAVINAIDSGVGDVEIEEVKEGAAIVPVITIQDRVREVSLGMTEEIEEAFEKFQTDPEAFDPKGFKVLNLLKGKGAKAAHARVIREYYAGTLAELNTLANGEGDEQLREGYSHRTKKQIRKFIDFLKEIQDACVMLGQEAKVNRKPRTKKPMAKDKIVAKLKYKKTDEPLKLVSIAPVDIVGASELWVYNSKTRKLGKFVAADFQTLSVKGTTIIGFSEAKSMQKTLRKPAEQFKEFKAAGKVQLRKFLDDINAVETKLNGRISVDILLLKAA